MSNALKNKGKFGVSLLIENQLPRAVYATWAALDRAASTPPGGVRCEDCMPLSATPFMILANSEGSQ